MLRHIAIVGAGGIGQRHLQSCLTLPAADYALHVVEPDAATREQAKALVGAAGVVHWYDAVAGLPPQLDIAIIATRADIRARVTREVIEITAARRLILEKVLFQRASDFAQMAELFERAGAAVWVNCPRRMWPVYHDLAARIRPDRIVRIESVGRSWDIGCNAIHFLDLFAFLTATAEAVVDAVELGVVQPAKRNGMLHIEGAIAGSLAAPDRRSVGFSIVSQPDHKGPQRIVIGTVDGDVMVEEDSAVTVTDPSGATTPYAIPFQSQLTAAAVQALVLSGNCELAPYALSRQLHEALLDPLRAALGRAGQLTDPDLCPVT
jgi:predicted dehydrogenase